MGAHLKRWAGRVAGGLRWLVRRESLAARRYRHLFEEAPVMRVVTRIENGVPVVTECNEVFLRALGYERGEILGRPAAECYAPESRAKMEEGGYQRAMEGTLQEEERYLLKRDGSKIAALLRAAPDFDEAGRAIGTQAAFIDITERKRMEEELRKNERKLRAVFENVSEVIYMVKGQEALTGEVELVGEQVRSVLGYESEEFVRDQGLWFRNIHSEDAAGVVEATQRIIASGKPGTRVYRLRHKLSGEWLWMEDRFTPQFDDGGRLTGVVGVARDVTEQKKAADQLALLSNVVHHTADSCVICNREGVIQYVNPAFTATTGYLAEEAVGQTPRILKSGQHDTSFYERLWKTVLAGAVFRAEFVNRKKNGELYYEEKTISPVIDAQGRVTHFISVGRDVTERKQAEEELRASSERFHDAFAHAATGMALTNIEGRFLEVNRAFCEITGYTERELAARDFASITHPGDVDRNMDLSRRLSAGEIPNYVLDKRYLRKDGSVVWVRISVSILRDSKHQPLRNIALVEDITERKQAEQALHQLSGRLLQLQDEERRRLARELHDSTAQSMAALSMNLSVMKESMGRLNIRGRRALNESMALADQCMREIRTLAYLMYPPELDEMGLEPALVSYVGGFMERSGIRVRLDVPAALGRLSRELEVTLFRIVQESLANIHRHSGSATAAIRIIRSPKEVVMEIGDQGRGLSGGEDHGNPPLVGVGIAGMRERAGHVGGRLEVLFEKSGTTVKAVIPVSGNNDSGHE